MFASFKEQKNHPLAFEAAARRVLQAASPARFLFVGDMLWAGLHGSGAYKERMDAAGGRARDPCSLPLPRQPQRRRAISTGRATSRCCRRCSRARRTSSSNRWRAACRWSRPTWPTTGSCIPDGVVGYVVPLGGRRGALADRLLDLLRDDESARRRLGSAARAGRSASSRRRAGPQDGRDLRRGPGAQAIPRLNLRPAAGDTPPHDDDPDGGGPRRVIRSRRRPPPDDPVPGPAVLHLPAWRSWRSAWPCSSCSA